MANIHVNRLGNPNITVGSQSNPNINTGNTTMPKYVGARAEVTRTENGVRIWLKDYKGETEEIIAEVISDIISNEDGSLTFVLPDGREITTDSLEGPQGPQGPQGIQGNQGIQGEDGVGISSITKTGTVGLVDTYTITYTDGTTSTYTVTNGQDGTSAVTDVEVDGVSVVTGGVAEIDLSGKADISDIPTKVSDLTNDSGFISSETDPTVPSWAKQQNKPSYMFSEIYGTPTTLSEYGITDAYTKSEVDVLVSAVLHFKGTKATASLLPSSGNKTGDVWHITSDGSEWAWDGSQWQELGTSVDLSGYVPTSRKINGNSLTSDVTLNIPTKTSDLTNDSGFITASSIPEEIYWAIEGTTTSAEIEAAYSDGKLVCVKSFSRIYILNQRVSLTKHTFVNITGNQKFTITCDNDSWTGEISSLESDVFWAIYGTTTNAEIEIAYSAGHLVCVKKDSRTYTLDYRTNSTSHKFHSITGDTVYELTCVGDAWSTSTTYLVPLDSNDKIIDYYLPDYHDIYWATYGTTTTTEIVQALIAGKHIFVEYGSRIYAFSKFNSSDSQEFSCFENGTEYRIACNGNVWSTSTTYLVPLDSNGKIDASYLPVYNGGVS